MNRLTVTDHREYSAKPSLLCFIVLVNGSGFYFLLASSTRPCIRNANPDNYTTEPPCTVDRRPREAEKQDQHPGVNMGQNRPRRNMLLGWLGWMTRGQGPASLGNNHDWTVVEDERI